MQTATEIQALIERVYEQRRVELSNVSWKEYEALLEGIGDLSIFVTYNNGECELQARGERSTCEQKLVRRMIDAVAYEIRVSSNGFGSTTWQRPDLAMAIEADESYFIQNYRILSEQDYDLTVDPPPDLVVEVEASPSTEKREPIFAALGFPELWRLKNRRVTFCALQTKRYAPIDKSLAFPSLTCDDFNHYFELWRSGDDFEAQRAFRQWVRDTLKPRT